MPVIDVEEGELEDGELPDAEEAGSQPLQSPAAAAPSPSPAAAPPSAPALPPAAEPQRAAARAPAPVSLPGPPPISPSYPSAFPGPPHTPGAGGVTGPGSGSISHHSHEPPGQHGPGFRRRGPSPMPLSRPYPPPGAPLLPRGPPPMERGPPPPRMRSPMGQVRGRPDFAEQARLDREKEDERVREERAKEELAVELAQLTSTVSFQDVRSSWTLVCGNLRNAIKKLDKLLRKVKRKRHDDVEQYPRCAEFSARIQSGLKHVLVLCGTGYGRTQDMDAAKALMRTAVNYRHDVLSAANKKELEALIKDSKEFKYLFEDRDKDKRTAATSGNAPAATTTTSAGQKAATAASSGAVASMGMGAPAAAGSDGAAATASGSVVSDHVSEASHAAPGPSGGTADGSDGAEGAQEGAAAMDGVEMSADAEPSPQSRAPPAADELPLAQQQSQSQPQPQPQQQPQQQRGMEPPAQQSKIRIFVSSSLPVAPEPAAEAPAAEPWPKRSQPDADSSGRDEQQQQAAKRARYADALASSHRAEAPIAQAQHVPSSMQRFEQQQQQQQQPQHTQQRQQHQALSDMPELTGAPGALARGLAELLQQRRLCLVLDLDHTLLNSVKLSEVDRDTEKQLEAMAGAQASLPEDERELFRLPRLGMWTKLRPGVRQFLARAAERFELWIHTAGNRAYAQGMVELLDPTGMYFGNRIIAQGHNGQQDDAAWAATKRLMQGLEGREPIVIIVDDSSAVWPHDRRNLFVVERYIFFPSSRRKFGMQGKSLMEIDRDECPSRGMLATAMSVFERVHSLVFAAMRGSSSGDISPWDVRNVMASEKRRVLAGVHVVFSRVIPLESDARQHPLWQLAEQFGATCSSSCGEQTTHVVATHAGTEKVEWAKLNGKPVVSPAWLECSCILWQRANESRFPTPNM